MAKTVKRNTRLSLPEAAALTGIGESTLRSAINNHRLRGERLGRDWRTTLAWIEAWVNNPEAHKHDPRKDERDWQNKFAVSA